MLKIFQNINQEELYNYTQNPMKLTSVGFDSDEPVYFFFELEFLNLAQNDVLDNILLRVNYVYSNDNNDFNVYLTNETNLTDSNRYTIKNQIEAGTLLPINNVKPNRIEDSQYQYLDVKLSNLNIAMENRNKVVFVVKAKSALQKVQADEFYKETNYCVANIIESEYVSPSQNLNKIFIDGNLKFLVDLSDGNLLTQINLFSALKIDNPINLILTRNQRISQNNTFPFNFSLNYYYDIQKEILDNNVIAINIIDSLGKKKRYFKVDQKNKNDYICYFNHGEISGGKYYNNITGECLYFSSTGEYTGIIKIYDKYNSVKTIFYNSLSLSQIDNIVNKEGRGIYFTWSNNKLIDISYDRTASIKDIQITYYTSGYIYLIKYNKLNLTVKFTYSATSITIEYINSGTIIKKYCFTFNNDLLTKVQNDVSGKIANLQYVSQKLTSLTLLDGNIVLDKLTFQYATNLTSVVDKLSRLKKYYFDKYKRCIQEEDQNSNYVCYEYYESTNLVSNKTIINAKKMMFTNGSFDFIDTYNNVLGWTISTNSSVSTYDIVEKEYGKCLKVAYKNSGVPLTISQKIYDETGGLSYIKGKICHSSFYYQNLIIKVEGTYVLNNTEYTFNNSITKLTTTSWFDFKLMLNIPQGAKNISATLSFVISGTNSCTIYFDEIETNLDVHSFYKNLIKNNNMDIINTNKIPSDWFFSNKISGEEVVELSSYNQNVGSRVLKLIGNTTLRSVYQNVLIKGLENEKYSFSINYKINSIMSYFKPFIKICYDDDEIETIYIDTYRSTNTSFNLDNITFKTKKAYSKFIVGVEYLGTGNAYVDNFKLIRINEYCDYKYDDRSNISSIEDSLGNGIRFIYNEDNLIDCVLTKDGLIYFFEYINKKLTSIKCSNGVKIEYSYDANGYRTSSIVTNGNETISTSNEKDADGYITKEINEYNYESLFTLDTLKNVVECLYPNKLALKYEYSENNELEAILCDSDTQSISYENKNRKIEKITSRNGDDYTFNYDEYGNILNVKFNNILLFENEYLNVSNQCSNLISTITKNNNVYSYTYDDQFRIVEVKLNNVNVLGIEYDDIGNIHKFIDENGNTIKQFVYDNNNRITNVVYDSNNLKYIYDNLGNVQKANKYIGAYCSYDYDYNCECNNTFGNYVNMIHLQYNHDIIIGNHNFVGINGLTPAINTLSKEEKYYNKIPYYSFNKESTYVSLKLDTTNFKMNKLLYQNEYNKFKDNFKYNKKIMVWFKPNSLGKITSLFKFQRYEENVNQVIAAEVRINKSGFIEYYQKGLNKILYVSSTKVNINKWNMLVINLTKEKDDSNCINKIILNGVTDDNFSDVINIELCNRLLVGYQDKLEKGDFSVSSELSYCPFDICYLSIGDKEIKLNDYSGLYLDGLNLIENDIDTLLDSVQYAKTEFNNSYEVFTFNGSLDSSRGLKPYIVKKKNNSNEFYLDSIKRKQCLAMLNFTKSKIFGILKLGYDLNLNNSGCLSVKFKLLDGSPSSYRYIFSFNDKNSDVQKMSVYVNNNMIKVEENNSTSAFSNTIKNDVWYTLTMFFNDSKLTLYLDSNLLGSLTISSSTLFSNCITYLGGNNNGVNLNGLMEMFVISRTYVNSSNYASIASLLSKDNMIKNTRKYDNLNRLVSRNITIGNNTFTQSYLYNKTQISEENLLGEIRRYSYDNMGNVIKIESKGLNDDNYIVMKKYTYDLLGRLEKEVDEENNECKYTYDKNGNIDVKEIKNNSSNKIIDYHYEVYNDRLDYILDSSINTASTTISYNGLYPKNININGVSRNIVYEGEKIKSFGNNEYFYNKEGIRIKKVTEKNKTHEYIVEGNKLLVEKITTTGTTTILAKLIYNYNQYEELVSVEYNDKLYFYIKDILGNIVKIVDENGVDIVKYSYNAWGVVTRTILSSDEDDYKLAQYNPFMYKGYYYDDETNLFLVTSRYYSPELGRFIQPADVSSLNPSSINGLNLYSYANNNPIGIAYSSSNVGFGASGGMINSLALGGLSSPGYNLGYSNSFNIFAGLNLPQLNVKDLVKDTFISLGEVGYRIAWGLTKNGRAFLDFHYSAYGINGYTALDNLPSTSAKIFKGIGFGLMALDVIEAGYYSYQNGHSFGQGALNVGLTAGKNILVYKASTGVATAVGTWAGAKLGASLGSYAGPVGFAIGAVAGAVVGWVIDEFGDVIIDWVVGWFD